MNLLIGVHDKEVKDQREERELEKGRVKKKKKCQVNYGIHEQPRKKKGEQMKKMYFTRRNSSD